MANRLRFILYADSFTEFHFLPLAKKASRKDVAHVGNAAESNGIVRGNVFDGASIGQSKYDFAGSVRYAWDRLRKIGEAPLDENRNLLRRQTSDDGKQVLDCLRLIAKIDDSQFREGNAVGVETAMKFYAQPFLAALVAAKCVRDIEQSFYKLYNFEYEIHYDLLNREVIIAKKAPRGLFGWLLRHSSRGYGIGKWRNAVLVGTVDFGKARR